MVTNGRVGVTSMKVMVTSGRVGETSVRIGGD